MFYLCVLLAFILLFLSLIHFYWAMGGQWAFEVTLPIQRKWRKVVYAKNN
jgi:hypothetical protein